MFDKKFSLRTDESVHTSYRRYLIVIVDHDLHLQGSMKQNFTRNEILLSFGHRRALCSYLRRWIIGQLKPQAEFGFDNLASEFSI